VIVFIDTYNVMAKISETGARNQADIARSNHCDFHYSAVPINPFANATLYAFCVYPASVSKTFIPTPQMSFQFAAGIVTF
jgi:hypothetical protein